MPLVFTQSDLGILSWESGAGGGPHASNHQNGGGDEINVAGLSGLLADAQTPLAHTHAQADVTNLVADLAGKAPLSHTHAATDIVSGTVAPARLGSGSGGSTKFLREDSTWQSISAGAHATEHQNGGGDEINVGGLSGLLADAQTPLSHEHVGSDITTGTVAAARLGSGSGGSSKFLREDNTWQNITGLPNVKQVSSQHDIASTTGTEVTDLSLTLTAGTYTFTYYLITQASNTTVGLGLGINYTGTVTRMAAFMRYADTGTTATTGVADSATAGIAEEMQGIFATITESTTACNLGPLTNHDAANTNTLIIVEGVMVVSDAGDIELWHNSDAANTTSIMVGSSLVLIKIA